MWLGVAGSVFIREVVFIQSALYREVPCAISVKPPATTDSHKDCSHCDTLCLSASVFMNLPSHSGLYHREVSLYIRMYNVIMLTRTLVWTGC